RHTRSDRDWSSDVCSSDLLPALAWATALFRIRSTRAYRAVRERLGLVTATLAEDISGMRVVQSFTRERANERRFREVNAHYRERSEERRVGEACRPSGVS